MRASFRQRGGWWVVVQFVLMLAVILLGIVGRGGGWEISSIAVGAALLVPGGVFGLAGVAALGRNRTPFPKPQADSALIQHGIYARVRHPLYTSVMLISLAWALLWQSWPALIAAVVLIPFFQAKARREERWLVAKFPDYNDYARRVPRFVPRWRRHPNLHCNF